MMRLLVASGYIILKLARWHAHWKRNNTASPRVNVQVACHTNVQGLADKQSELMKRFDRVNFLHFLSINFFDTTHKII